MLNPSIELIKARTTFYEQGIVSIPNFFDLEYLKNLETSIRGENSILWFHVLGDEDGESNSSYFINTDTEKLRADQYNIVTKKIVEKKSAHSFKELSAKLGGAPLKNVLSYFNNKDFKDTLKYITQCEVAFPRSLCVNKFENGDFISQNKVGVHDGIDFIINITPDWHFDLGANYSYFIPNKELKVKTLENDFNCLTLLNPRFYKHLHYSISGVSAYGHEKSKILIRGHYENITDFLKVHNI